MQSRPKPLLLLVLDGWGYSENPDSNAILNAKTPVWDRLWSEYPHTLIRSSGAAVGLPDDQMGNSEVGHMTLGAGRVVYQDYTRITRAIEDGSFAANPALLGAIDAAVAQGKAVHVMGLLSPGGVHSHEAHLQAAVRLAAERGAERILVHVFLDGRDTPPRSASASIRAMEQMLRSLGRGRLVSLVGRYYAMDRDQRWDRVSQAYALLVEGRSAHLASTALSGLEAAYARGEGDEFVQPTVVAQQGEAPVRMEDGDAVLVMNFRADRAREIVHALADADFPGFDRGRAPRLRLVCLTEYDASLDVPVAFGPAALDLGLGEYLAKLGLKQLRIAETEKYAHVTFFFSGGREQPFQGEARVLVPSPRVATYDLQPEMSAPEVTDRLVDAIGGGEFDVIICNYANADMVGHTGIYPAAVKAVEAVDRCLGRIVTAVEQAGGEMLITADHGNAEKMRDADSGEPHTAHTLGPVPLIYVGRSASLAKEGSLADIAPSMLRLMGLEQPREMTGTPLVELL
jgi:2,3-bisphosphoglycerate-independent phosphoglycerate mutase